MKRILHVEDEKESAKICRAILEGAGYKVDRALSGRQGLKFLKKNDYDLALLDIRLPDMSAWEIYQKIKNKSVKFALLSSLTISDERRKALRKSGLHDYIVKPYRKKDLTERVHKIMRKRR